MKKILIAIGVLIVLGVGAYIIFGMSNASGANTIVGQSQAATLIPTQIPPVIASGDVTVEGNLTPKQSTSLSFNTSGVVEELLVAEGQKVEQGQLLARLHTQEDLAASQAAANYELANAQKALDDLNHNAESVALQIAEELIPAKKALTDAQKKRTQLNTPRATTAQIDQAKKEYNDAVKVVKDLEYYQNMTGDHSKSFKDSYDAAVKDRNLKSYMVWYLSGPRSQDEIFEADAAVASAQYNYDDLQRRYEIYKNGPDPADVKVVEARIENAKAQLATADNAIKGFELRAPVTGTIVNINIAKGEYASPGTTVITIADFSSWYIETSNLTELNVTRIQVGSPVEIVFDALPDDKFTGKVISIDDQGISVQGEITYRVVIELDQSDPRLRWNMTASVVIATND